VRKAFNLWFCLALFLATGYAAQQAASGEPFVGTWSGTWEGAGGTGGIEVIFEKAKDGSIGGRVSVTGEPTYKATFERVSLEGSKFTGNYTFPPDDSIGVVLAGTVDGNSVKGTWAAREKAGGGDVASGTWTATRQ
jgi:hypothetical protein